MLRPFGRWLPRVALLHPGLIWGRPVGTWCRGGVGLPRVGCVHPGLVWGRPVGTWCRGRRWLPRVARAPWADLGSSRWDLVSEPALVTQGCCAAPWADLGSSRWDLVSGPALVTQGCVAAPWAGLGSSRWDLVSGLALVTQGCAAAPWAGLGSSRWDLVSGRRWVTQGCAALHPGLVWGRPVGTWCRGRRYPGLRRCTLGWFGVVPLGLGVGAGRNSVSDSLVSSSTSH